MVVMVYGPLPLLWLMRLLRLAGIEPAYIRLEDECVIHYATAVINALTFAHLIRRDKLF